MPTDRRTGVLARFGPGKVENLPLRSGRQTV